MKVRHSLVYAALLLTACTSTTGGSGRTASTPGRSGPASTLPGSTSSVPPGPTPSPVPAALVRSPHHTAIGDPATADLCAAVGLAPFANLTPAVTASFDARQYPPGCSITLAEARGPVLAVTVFAAKHGPRPATGRHRRTASGLPVYAYPFDKVTGSCERDITADAVRLVVDSLTRGPAIVDAGLACGATDAMTDRLAQAVTAEAVPRLVLAQPSVTEFNSCAVAQQAGITSLADFATAHLIRRGFSVNCELESAQVYLFINVAVASGRSAQGTPHTVGGHPLSEVAARPGFCSYVSQQGATPDGAHEEIAAAATTADSGKVPHALCGQTAQALAAYLTAAGLN